MCGIVGIMDVSGTRAIDRELIARLNETQHHRGPDEEGLHIEPGIGLGHKRLSIIDLSMGQQPLFNEDRTVYTTTEPLGYETSYTWSGSAVGHDGKALPVAGKFTTVNGSTATRIAKLDAVTGALVPGFSATAPSVVNDIALWGNKVILGGQFAKIDNVARLRLASIDAGTGALDPNVNLSVNGLFNGGATNIQKLTRRRGCQARRRPCLSPAICVGEHGRSGPSGSAS